MSDELDSVKSFFADDPEMMELLFGEPDTTAKVNGSLAVRTETYLHEAYLPSDIYVRYTALSAEEFLHAQMGDVRYQPSDTPRFEEMFGHRARAGKNWAIAAPTRRSPRKRRTPKFLRWLFTSRPR